MGNPILTQEYIRELFTYDGVTLRWKVRKAMRNKIGDRAGSPNNHGYFKVNLDGKSYKVHRLIWLYVHGYIPEEIDHINHNPMDNRLDNLRASSRTMNMRNASKRVDNSSGYPGVMHSLDRWTVNIGTGKGRRRHLGYYDTIEEAISMRLTAEDYYGYL